MFVILSLVSCFMFIILKYVFITHTVLFLHVFSYINDIILYVFHVFSNFIYIYKRYYITWASLVAKRVKILPDMGETGVGSLGREDPLEKGMATHSSIVAWRIPWTEELGGLQSMGSQRVRPERLIHTHIILCILMQEWQWHPTPVLLPGKSHGRRSLVGCSPWGR